MKKDEALQQRLRDAFPGEDVRLGTGDKDFKVKVFPLAFRCTREFIELCAELGQNFSVMFDLYEISMEILDAMQKAQPAHADGDPVEGEPAKLEMEIDTARVADVLRRVNASAFSSLMVLLDQHVNIDLNDEHLPAPWVVPILIAFIKETLSAGKLQEWGRLFAEVNNVVPGGTPSTA